MKRIALLVAAVLLVSCGVPTDENATPIDLDEVGDLFVTSTTTSVPEPNSEAVTVFLTDTETSRLAETGRQVAPPVGVRAVTDALLAGTTGRETRRGLRTAIPQGTELLDSEEVRGVLVLNFNDTFKEVEREAQSQAFAQIVYTVTELDEDALIEFRIEDVPQSVLTDAGEPVSRCVNRDDFQTLAPDYDPDDPPPSPRPPKGCAIEIDD